MMLVLLLGVLLALLSLLVLLTLPLNSRRSLKMRGDGLQAAVETEQQTHGEYVSKYVHVCK